MPPQYGPLHQQQWMLEEMRGFAKDMQDLEMKWCCKCKEYWVHNGETRNEGFVCEDCWKQCDNMPKFSDGNNMDPGDVPPELRRLTMIEEMLIALSHAPL